MHDEFEGVTMEQAHKMYGWYKSGFRLNGVAWYAARACKYARYAGFEPDPVLVLVAELEKDRDIR